MEDKKEETLCLAAGAEPVAATLLKEEPIPMTAADMAAELKVPAWRSAALLRYKDWLPDKVVTREEYEKALGELDNRRLGGGRS